MNYNTNSQVLYKLDVLQQELSSLRNIFLKKKELKLSKDIISETAGMLKGKIGDGVVYQKKIRAESDQQRSQFFIK